jgi:putative nucleotidyltransferase with HDIG domain
MTWVYAGAAAIVILAGVAAVTWYSRRYHGTLDGGYLQFIEALAEVLDARDPYTAGHSLRVAQYAHAIALQMGISAKQASQIRIAAQLHDIGKIALPDAVLQKPGTLSPEEYGLVKLHPQIGRKMLEKVTKFAKLLDVIELHHENFDGSGYPYRLAGERIPRDVRIVHVADAFDAMTTNRSYRRALSQEQAVDELRTHSGTQFDPEVVEAFLRLGKLTLTEPWRVVREEWERQPVA